MDRKFRPGANGRFDIPDALSIHDLADDGLRASGRVLHTASEPGLTISAAAFAPVAAVVHGFEVVDNPLDNQQVLITPGVALCEEVIDGALSGGQISTPRVQRPMTLGGAAVTKYVWARFVYLDGDSQNRAFWQPSTVPEREQVRLHDTRFVAEYQVDYTDAAVPPAAGAGWFLLATVDYSGGVVGPGLIYDRRVLLFEGQADGLNNPATGWSIPEFDRTDDRSNVGSRSLFGFVMRALRRFMDLSGRKWYEPPAYGENVRSASGVITVSNNADNAPHFDITDLPSIATVQAVMRAVPTGVTDGRRSVRFVPGIFGTTEFTVDTTLASVDIGSADRVMVDGQALFDRGTGSLPIFATSATGRRGVIRDLTLRASTLGDPVLSLGNDADDVVFVGCTFDAPAKVTNLVQITSAGRYTFIDCKFTGDNTVSTTLVNISGTARVHFIACDFGGATTGARRGIYVSGGTPLVSVESSTFTTLSYGIESLVASAPGAVTGCTFSGIINDDLAVFGFYGQGAFDAGAHFGGDVVGQTLRSNGAQVFMGDGTAFVTMSDGVNGLLTGNDGAGGMPDIVFDNYYSLAGRYIFGSSSPSTTGDRVEKLAAGAGGGADPERFAFLDGADVDVPTIPLHARRLILGNNAADLRAVLSAHVAVKAWGLCRYTNGAPDTQAGGGWRYDEAGLTVNYTAFNPGAGSNQHKWEVSGLGLANNEYAVIISVSVEPAAESSVYFGGGAGYFMNAVVYNKSATGFDIAPVLSNTVDSRLALDDGALAAAINSYDINFIVIAHSTVL